MAINFAGGTDVVSYGAYSAAGTSGCFAFWFRTTQTTVNACPCFFAVADSTQGVLFLLNNTANKMQLYSKIAAGDSLLISGTTTVNDGNWHHAAANWQNGLGSPASLYIDGNLDASGTQSRAWTFSTVAAPYFGDSPGAFWPSFVGDIAEFGVWNRNLGADEIKALAKGFAPPRVAQSALKNSWYLPMVRDARNRTGSFAPTVTGTTVSNHPRIMGSLP